MPSAERSVTINRPAAEVFSYVSDGARATEWRSGVAETKLESGSGVGAVYMQRVRGPMGRSVRADYEITKLEPNKKIEFKTIAGPVRPTGGYRLNESGGKTKVTFWLKEDLGGWKRLLLGRSVQRSMDAEMKALDKLKSVVEASAGVSTSSTKASTDAKGSSTSRAATGTPTPTPSKAGTTRETSSAKPAATNAAATKAAAAKAAAAKPAAPRTARRKPKSS